MDVHSDGAADWGRPLVHADVGLSASVQAGRDLPSSTDIRLISRVIHSNCAACIVAQLYYHSWLCCNVAEIHSLPQATHIITAPAGLCSLRQTERLNYKCLIKNYYTSAMDIINGHYMIEFISK